MSRAQKFRKSEQVTSEVLEAASKKFELSNALEPGSREGDS
jgi:hypothetical protein